MAVQDLLYTAGACYFEGLAGLPNNSPAVLLTRKRNRLRLGFGLVIALLVFSTVQAFRIVSGLSEESTEIHHRHLKQADLLFNLRRTLWLGASASRDFLLNPLPDRSELFTATHRALQDQSRQLLADLERLSFPADIALKVGSRIEEFWAALARMPAETEKLDARQRYEYVQREISARRVAVGDLVREFAEISRQALTQAETEFAESRRSAARHLLVSLGVALLFAAVVAVFSLRHSEHLEAETARQYDRVTRAKAELQQLSARLMEIQEEERTRLSRELHDEIGQALATLRLELSRAESARPEHSEAIRERLARARTLAERTIQTVRNISLLLRPALLDDLGLGPALQWLTEDFTRRTGVSCNYVEKWIQAEMLPDPVRTCVFRVLQEALHNCEKHSQAMRVQVSVEQRPESLTVTIEDNGCGFDVASDQVGPVRTRFGILGIRERAAALGGEAEFNSALGAGTRVVLRLPVRAEAQPSNSGAAVARAGE